MKSKDLILILNELGELRNCGIYINDTCKIDEFKIFLKSYYKYKNCNDLLCKDCFSVEKKNHVHSSQEISCMIEKINDRTTSLHQTLIKYTELLIKYYKLIGGLND